MEYDEGATQQMTRQSAKSIGGVSSSAGKQASAARRPKGKHIVIDGRIRRASTGRPIDRLIEQLQDLDRINKYTILLEPRDTWRPRVSNFKVHTIRYKQFSFNPLQQITFAYKLHRLKPDLVHFTLTPQQPIFYFGRQITFTHDLTMLKFVRAGRLPKWLHKLRMLGYRFLLWSAHRHAARILVPTEYVKDAVHKYHLFTRRKIVVTLEAGDLPISAAAKKPESAPENFIMYVGSAFPHKNLERLISAYNLLKETHADLKLVLVGKQEYHSKQLERWAKRQGLGEGVVFTGFVPDEELKWYYENAKAYVFASLSEGFGLPGLEAMVNGCPVVSSNATCIPEVLGDAAHYFDPEDINDMAAKIDEVIANKTLSSKLVERGKSQVKKYSWERMAQQTLAVYKEVLEL